MSPRWICSRWLFRSNVGDSGHPGEGFWRAVGKVVQDQQVVTGLEQNEAGVAADETGAACDQNAAAHRSQSSQHDLILKQLRPAGRLSRCT